MYKCNKTVDNANNFDDNNHQDDDNHVIGFSSVLDIVPRI